MPIGASYPVQPNPLLPDEASAASASSASSNTTEAPLAAHSKATAKPTIPPPITKMSIGSSSGWEKNAMPTRPQAIIVFIGSLNTFYILYELVLCRSYL